MIDHSGSSTPRRRRVLNRAMKRRQDPDQRRLMELLMENKALTYTREGGMCARCGTGRADECQHRQARGMGGSSLDSQHAPSHLVWLCRSCHADVERHSRTDGVNEGFVVFHGIVEPIDVPILYRGHWALLDNVGTVTYTGQPPATSGSL